VVKISEFLGEITLGGTSARELKHPKPEDLKRIKVFRSRGRHTSRDRVFWVKALQKK
jgi:hypothetical protein